MVLRPIVTILIFALLASACSGQSKPASWIGTWTAAQQLVEPKNQPPLPLSHHLLRQSVHLSIGGDQLVVHFSNAFGNDPLEIESADVAQTAGAGQIKRDSDRMLSFNGHPNTAIPPGGQVQSDPLSMQVNALSDLTITLKFGSVPSQITGHPGSRCTSYLFAADNADSLHGSTPATTAHWYVLSGIDVLTTNADAASVVILGDSITDGRGSGTDRNDRWPDLVAKRLPGVGVLNAGIGGNKLLTDGLGQRALARFDRDVKGAAGIRWVVVLEGINDIGNGIPASSITTGYADLIARSHQSGIKIYGATLLPFGGSAYSEASPDRENQRQQVNAWVRAAGHFDAVIDFDKAMRDPNLPTHLRADCDSGDHLHPNEMGYRVMANSINLELFKH